jgi:hypothetical protein
VCQEGNGSLGILIVPTQPGILSCAFERKNLRNRTRVNLATCGKRLRSVTICPQAYILHDVPRDLGFLLSLNKVLSVEFLR